MTPPLAASTPEVPATIPLGAEPDYLAQALIRGPVAHKDGAPTGVEWVVRDGTGHALGATDFAHLTDDKLGEQRLADKRRGARWEGVLLAGVGAALEVVAVGYLAGGNTNNSESEDWLWRGATAAAVGAFPIAVCTLPSRANKDRERWTALYYTAPQVDPLIDAHNAAVRVKLGLPALPSTGSPSTAVAPVPVLPSATTPQDAPPVPPVDKLTDAEPTPGGGK